MQTVTIQIAGMVCGGCSGTVQKALLALEGVGQADVSHVAGTAVVIFDPAQIQPSQIQATIEAAGYAVR
jgi:copper chaperone